jgi:hypothetical protein
MPVKLERNVCLPLTASKDLQVDLRTDYKFGPLLERRARLDFTFPSVLPIQRFTDWALHSGKDPRIILQDSA